MLLVGGEGAADACAVRAWRLAQEFWKQGQLLVPETLFRLLPGSEHLLGVCLAVLGENGVYVRGSSAYLDWLNEKKIAGAVGGKKSAKRPRNAKGQLVKTSKQNPSTDQADSKCVQASSSSSSSFSSSSSSSGSEILNLAQGSATPAPSSLVWAKYSDAYERRYGAKPTRNASVNGKLAQFLKRVAAEEAPAIAAFFVAHNDQFYVKSMHPVGLLLKDAEKLRTEWATGRQVTSGQARQIDRRQTNFNAFSGLIAEAEANEREGGKGV